jgi:hypothetical protein
MSAGTLDDTLMSIAVSSAVRVAAPPPPAMRVIFFDSRDR